MWLNELRWVVFKNLIVNSKMLSMAEIEEIGDNLERIALVQALDEANGDQIKAGKRLGISQPTVCRKIQKLL